MTVKFQEIFLKEENPVSKDPENQQNVYGQILRLIEFIFRIIFVNIHIRI